ncbi:TetR-like C-terminal domain-containing protein [Streptomyces sp. NPDC005151]
MVVPIDVLSGGQLDFAQGFPGPLRLDELGFVETDGRLVAEALRAALPAIGEAPDCGSIREDLYQLGRRLRDAMLSTPGTALLSVLHECDSSASGRFQAVIFQGVIQPSTELFRKVVSRGVERGDVRSDATSDLTLDVIPAMMMYRSKVCGSE